MSKKTPGPTLNVCAVEDCWRPGSPQVCLYDGAFHGHGRVHYDCRRAERTAHGLTFRADSWRQLCAEHYDVLRRALEAAEE
jgi:hypothetical protein